MKQIIISSLLLLAAFAYLCSPLRASAAGTLLQYNFDTPATWPVTAAKPNQLGVSAGKFGTIDVAGGVELSGGLHLLTEGDPREAWVAALKSGPLAVQNRERNLGKLTLAFDLCASRALPIRVVVESYNQKQERTGGLETVIYPAAADFYQRHALDLAGLRSAGEGVFDPAAPFVSFSFEVDSSAGWPGATRHEIRLDNIHYAVPAYYVSPQGDDKNDGLAEASAFATPQRAIEAARAGDVIVLMEGTYADMSIAGKKPPVARFVRPGTPAGWITLKNYPGQRPTLSARGQEAVNISRTPPGSPEEADKLSYIEVRGLHVRGNGDTARTEFPDKIGRWSPETTAQGIVINGRFTPHPGERTPGEIVHHIRLADNVIEYCAGDGVYIEYCDWLFVENNRVQNNCWVTIGYAPAGLAVMGYANFDAVDNVYKMLMAGNHVSGNRLEVMNQPWGKTPKTTFFNGNGFLFDANAETPAKGVYLGRTLVQNNLVFNNGAGGIQMWANHRMDLINNTVYQNGTVLPWGEIGFERCRDVRLVNNIIVARPDHALDTWFTTHADRGTDRILRLNNLYWGGIRPPIVGVNDIIADPLFINPSTDPATADFRLQAQSQAVGAGRWEIFGPAVDLDGKRRSATGASDLGAFQR